MVQGYLERPHAADDADRVLHGGRGGLTLVGVFSVTTYAVSRQARDIAIHMAVGARRATWSGWSWSSRPGPSSRACIGACSEPGCSAAGSPPWCTACRPAIPRVLVTGVVGVDYRGRTRCLPAEPPRGLHRSSDCASLRITRFMLFAKHHCARFYDPVSSDSSGGQARGRHQDLRHRRHRDARALDR